MSQNILGGIYFQTCGNTKNVKQRSTSECKISNDPVNDSIKHIGYTS